MDWHTEIVELHEAFEAWFLGESDSLDRVEAALDSRFTIVGPNGSETDRTDTIRQIEAGRGHTDDLKIVTSDHRLLDATDDLVVARYVEAHQWPDGRSNRRLSTVIFRRDPTGPHGVRWLRVHETWLDRDETESD